jgi:uncharacterized protein YceK
MKTAMICALAALTLTGCASVYTHIEKKGEKTYLLTRDDTGFLWSHHGSLHECTVVDEAKMKCRKVAEP